MKKKSMYHIKAWLALLLTLSLILTAGCGSKKEKTAVKSGSKTLKEINEIPEDGVITKEQFETVAGEDKQIQFTGETEDGIQYVWTYNAAQIQNPEDQNLKIDFTSENLEEIKTQANDANDALKLTMHGKGVICIPTLTITLPEAWQSDTGLLLKEQGGNLARMSDVTVESKLAEEESQSESNTLEEKENTNTSEETALGQKAEQSSQEETSDKKDNTQSKESKLPQKGKTTLSMQVISLDGDCYIVGGIAGNQNKGADAANGSNSSKAAGTSGGQANNQTTGNGAASQGNSSQDNGQQSNQGGSQSANNDGDSQSVDNESGDIENDIETQQISHTCTISISCATIINNMDNLTSGKEEFVPTDGWILAASTVEFEEGESVHDVLKRVCKEAGIHMESSYTPAYNSAYVEGINQLYEFDCGQFSGWMYKVNGWFPNYGCSKYTVSDGDVIDWVYTCDLGKDVGDNSTY